MSRQQLNNSFKYPWISQCAPAHHHRVAAGFRKHSHRILRLPDIAIADYRNFNGLFDFCNDFPVGMAGESLIGRPAMNNNRVGSRIFRNSGNFHGIDRTAGPAGTNFTVTGIFTAFITAAMMRPARTGSFIKMAPEPVLMTFFTGQPILISIKSGRCPATNFAASAMISGSAPKICAPRGRSSGDVFKYSRVLADLRIRPLALIISVKPTHSRTRGLSVETANWKCPPAAQAVLYPEGNGLHRTQIKPDWMRIF